jgi:hypothetical protein
LAGYTYIEAILVEKEQFKYSVEFDIFVRTFDRIWPILGEGAFCKYKSDQPIGGLAPAHYEAIAIGFARRIEAVEHADPTKLRAAVTAARQTAQFRENVGPGANKKSKLEGRISVIEKAIVESVV